MLEFVIGVLYVGTSARIVKHFRPRSFTSTDPARLATDVALTAAGAVTIAPVVILGAALSQLAGIGSACAKSRK